MTASRTRGAILTVVALLLATGSSPAAAQGWTVDLYGGRVAYDLASTTLAENGAIVGLRYRQADQGWFSLTSGIPFGSGDSTWGALGLGTRLAGDVGAIELGADLGAQGFLYRDPALFDIGRGGVLEARPLAAFEDGGFRLQARSGWMGYASGIAANSFTRGVHDSDLSLRIPVGGWATLSGTLRHVRAEEGDYSFGGGRLTVGSGRVRAWGSVGGWTSELLPTTEWATGASVRLDRAGRTYLAFSVREDAADPVYWTSPRGRWSVGVSHTLGGGSGGSPSGGSIGSPRPSRPGSGAGGRSGLAAFETEVSNGRVTVRIPASGAGEAPSIAGDFTGWKPRPMAAEGRHWTASFRLGPGVYRYAFRSPSGEWYVPEEIPSRRPDGMGGHVAVLVVS